LDLYPIDMPDEVSISFEMEKIDKKRQKIDKENFIEVAYK